MTHAGLSNSEYMDAMLFGPMDQGTANYFQEKVQALQTYIPESFQHVYHDLRDTVNRYTSLDLQDAARAVVSHVGNMWKGDYIRPLVEVSDIQAAPPVMRRWIMAQPDIRELYHKQECSGYDEDYIDVQPGVVGEDHDDYLRVVGGMVIDNEDGGYDCMLYNHTMEEEVQLTHDEKSEILTTWQSVAYATKQRSLDPTSKYGQKF